MAMVVGWREAVVSVVPVHAEFSNTLLALTTVTSGIDWKASE